MAELAKALGMKGASSYQRYESEDLFQKKVLPLDMAQRLADIFSKHGIDKAEVLELAGLKSDAPPTLRTNSLSEAHKSEFHFPLPASKDLPIYGMAEANSSKEFASFTLGQSPIAMAERPPQLAGVNGAFAVYIVGDSMYPRYKSGETVYINPHLAYRAGDDVLIELRDKSIMVKELVREDKDHWVFQQFNPRKEMKIKKADIAKISRVTGASGV